MLTIALESPEQMRATLQTLRKRLSVPPGSPLPIGVGFLAWLLDRTEATEEPRLPAVLEEKPKAIWFAFGEDLGKYVRQVREQEAKREHKTLVFVCVNSVQEARVAVEEWKVDVLVAQGLSYLYRPPYQHKCQELTYQLRRYRSRRSRFLSVPNDLTPRHIYPDYHP